MPKKTKRESLPSLKKVVGKPPPTPPKASKGKKPKPKK